MRKIMLLTTIVVVMVVVNSSCFGCAFASLKHGSKTAPDSLNSPYIIKSDKNGEYHCRRNGTPLYKNRFWKVDPFQEGVACVQDKESKKFLYIDTSGKMVSKQKYVMAHDFVGGYAVVRDDRGEFHINLKNWKALSDRRFYKARDFHEGLAAVSNEDEDWFFEDTLGTLLKKKYASVSDFHEGIALVEDEQTGKFFYADKKEKPICENQYDEATDFVNDTATAKDGRVKVLLILKKDKTIETLAIKK